MKEIDVILVNDEDKEVGLMKKMDAHKNALLHRAVSVFIVNSKGEWLLQRRAISKYHSGGLWTNTCCTHPLPNETNMEAANRRLNQEMGLQCNLSELFSFKYKESLDNFLTEYELDHVFMGINDQIPMININEVSEYKYIEYKALHKDILKNPDNYTAWFRKIFERVQSHIAKKPL